MWKKIFIYNKYKSLEPMHCFFYDRKSNIPLSLIKYQLFIHTGRTWNPMLLNRWFVGHKVGSFTWNRKLAIFKVKQVKKNK